MANPDAPARLEPRKNSVLRFLSFNIQVGITTCAYRQYLTRGWKHLLPHEERHENLKKIAKIVSDYDLVALQEVDAGSLRSGYVNQVAYLADKAIFPYWYAQLNRDLGRFAQHGNGLLSRIKPSRLEDHKLPGMLPGRGAITMRFQFSGVEVLVILMHLSLGTRSRHLQLEYVHRLIEGEEHVVLIGDMNSHLQSLLFNSPLESTNLRPAEEVLPTYPSWQPAVALDHVLVTPGLEISEFEVLDCNISDHLPVSVSLSLSSNTDASSPRRGRMQ
ncbi:MAG: endonuclease/exonuclease/phosphatase family protein [Pseudomonadales bacterium]|nr:endonuclease/exonuclease/phosphatase family protein [Pseudomonadales bacterium]